MPADSGSRALEQRIQIDSAKKKLLNYLFIYHLLKYFSIVLFILGSLIIFARSMSGASGNGFLWFFTVLVPTAFLAYRQSACRLPSDEVFFALFDSINECGGLVMSEREVSLNGWHASKFQYRDIDITFQWQRPFTIFALAVIFCCSAILFPQQYSTLHYNRPFDISKETGKLEDQIDLLAEENIIDRKQAEEYKSQLEQMSQSSKAEEPSKTWESLDHLKQNLENQAQAEAELDKETVSKAAQAENIAESLSEKGSTLSPEMMKESEKELSRRLEELMKSSESLASEIPESLKENLKQGTADSNSLKEMKKLLENAREMKLEKSRKLCNAKLISEDQMKELQKAAESRKDDLCAYLKENSENGSSVSCESGISSFFSSSESTPGISRGGGDQMMTWRDPVSETGVKFKEKVIPLNSVDDIEKSLLINKIKGSPDLEENADGIDLTTGLKISGTSAGSAIEHRILPAQKHMLQKYFKQIK